MRRIPGAAQAAFLPIDSGHTIEARHRHWDRRTRSFKTINEAVTYRVVDVVGDGSTA